MSDLKSTMPNRSITIPLSKPFQYIQRAPGYYSSLQTVVLSLTWRVVISNKKCFHDSLHFSKIFNTISKVRDFSRTENLYLIFPSIPEAF